MAVTSSSAFVVPLPNVRLFANVSVPAALRPPGTMRAPATAATAPVTVPLPCRVWAAPRLKPLVTADTSSRAPAFTATVALEAIPPVTPSASVPPFTVVVPA